MKYWEVVNRMKEINREIMSVMQRKIRLLFPSKAALARLRRSVGKEYGTIPEVLEYVLPEHELCGYPAKERQIEIALYTALTLYAFHQQGRAECVSDGLEENDKAVSNRNTFGHAIRRLSSVAKNPEGVLRRFNQVLTANDLLELSTHARGLISLLKQSRLALDYPLLATDFYYFQQAETRRSVVLSWGRDYYMNKRKEEEK